MDGDVTPMPGQVEGQDRRDEPDVAPVIDICGVEGGEDDGDRR